MPVKLQRLDIPLGDIDLPTGLTVLGRGRLLQCADKRISRTHADLNCESDGRVFLVPRHVNPCFLYKSDTNEVLKKDVSVELKGDDVFSLLPDKFRYKVIFEREKLDNNGTDAAANGKSDLPEKRGKRVLPSWLASNGSASKAKMTTTKQQRKDTSPWKPAPKCGVSKDDDGGSSTMLDKTVVATSSEDKNLADDVADVKNSDHRKSDDKDDGSPDENAQVNSSPVRNDDGSARRDSCQYGRDCYRNNAAHFREFSHPGDSDYSSTDEDNDDRLECEYGTRCYRKNAQHKKQFKHTRKAQPKRAATQKKRVDHQSFDDDSDDEYDLEDSFLTDDSDVYNPDSDLNM